MQKAHGVIIGLFLMAIALVTPPARADQMSFQTVNGVAYGGYYVSPYTAQDKTLGKTIQLYCLDFNHDVNFGQQWTANLYTMTQSNSANYQYGANNYQPNTTNPPPSFVTDPNDSNFTVWDRYQAAAWLFAQEGTSPTARVLGVYEYAAWQLFLDTADQSYYFSSFNSINDTDPTTHDTFQQDVNAALAASMNPANYGSTDLTRWEVVTPVPAGYTTSVQEFLTPITPVPEPSTVIPLVVASLAGLIAYKRRRRTIS